MGTVCAGQDAALAQPIHDVGCLLGGWLARGAVLNQVQAKKQPRTANIPDQRMPLLKRETEILKLSPTTRSLL